MRAAVATALSLAGVLVAGSAAALVNTQVLSGSDDGSAVGALATSTSAAPVPSSSVVVAPSSTVAGSTQSTYQVGDAGLVTVDAAGGSLVLVSVAPNPGWSVSSTGIGPLGALEVHLVDGTVDVRFLAVLVDGEVTVEVTATEVGASSGSTPGVDDDHDEDDDEYEHEEDDDEEHEHGEGYEDDD